MITNVWKMKNNVNVLMTNNSKSDYTRIFRKKNLFYFMEKEAVQQYKIKSVH